MRRRGLLRVGLLAALLALAGQLALAATVPDPVLARAGIGVICHASNDRQPPAHHAPACAFCPLCMAFAAAAPGAGRSVPVPGPRSVTVARAAILPPATAPPRSDASGAAQPRGPPVRV